MKKFKTVEEYIGSAPKNVQVKLNQVRSLIKKAAPKAIEKISYAIPFYGYHGRLVYFSYFKNHIGLYIMHGVLDDFAGDVKPYKSGKATLRFDLDKPLPLTFIRKLVLATKAKNEKEEWVK